MKKLISVFAALALVGAVAAKPAPKKPAAPAKPAVAAPAVPAPAAAAVAAAGNKDSFFQLGVYGGYNIYLSSTVGGTSVTTTPPGAGGIYGGLDALWGHAFKFGVGVAYSQTNTTSGATQAMLPIVAKIRYYFIPSIFVGVNAGYAIDLSTSVSGTTRTFIPTAAELGYALNFGGVGLDIGAQLSYIIGSTKSDVLGTSVTTASTGMFVTPYVRVAFQF